HGKGSRVMVSRENRPPLPAKTKANITVGVAAVIALGWWHVAVWATSDGLALTDVVATVAALVRLDPLALGDGIRTADMGVVVTVWLVLVVASLGGVFALVSWRHRRRAAKGMVSGSALQRRTGASRGRGRNGATPALLAPMAMYNGE